MEVGNAPGISPQVGSHPATVTPTLSAPLTLTLSLAQTLQLETAKRKICELESKLQTVIPMHAENAVLAQKLNEQQDARIEDLREYIKDLQGHVGYVKEAGERLAKQSAKIEELSDLRFKSAQDNHRKDVTNLALRRVVEQAGSGLGKVTNESHKDFWTRYLTSCQPAGEKLMTSILLKAYNCIWQNVPSKDRKLRIAQVVNEIVEVYSDASGPLHLGWASDCIVLVENEHSPTRIALLVAFFDLEGIPYELKGRRDPPVGAPAPAPPPKDTCINTSTPASKPDEERDERKAKGPGKGRNGDRGRSKRQKCGSSKTHRDSGSSNSDSLSTRSSGSSERAADRSRYRRLAATTMDLLQQFLNSNVISRRAKKRGR